MKIFLTKRKAPIFALLIFSLLTVSCDNTNEGGTGVSNPPVPSSSLVSAMSEVFADVELTTQNDVGIQKLFNAFKAMARADTFTEETCNSAAPEGMGFELVGETDDFTDGSQSYGAAQSPIVVTTADFCIDSAHPSENNTATGPDGNGLFASYNFRSDGHVTAVCSNAAGSLSLELGGRGIYRKTTDELEVYGLFHALLVDGEFDSNCTLILQKTTGAVVSKACSDITTGEALTLDADTTCVVTVAEE